MACALASAAAAQDPQPTFQIVAQMVDRCMATYAVRLTRTTTDDASIYTQAAHGCQGLNDQLRASLTAQVPPEQATEIIRLLDASARPNFLAMVARIRSDRAAREGATGAQPVR